MAYTSTMFATPEAFEEWCKRSEHVNRDAIDNICKEDLENWNKKATNLRVSEDGKLELLDCKGNRLCYVDICKSDGTTIVRDADTGAITVKAIIDRNTGNAIKIWYGTSTAYKSILVRDPNTIYLCSDVVSKVNNLCDKLAMSTNGYYVGTGVYGSNNPNKIVFPFVPKMVHIMSADGSSFANWVFGVSNIVARSPHYVSGEEKLPCTLDGDTLSWYNSTNEKRQFNTSGEKYYYFAVGTLVE